MPYAKQPPANHPRRLQTDISTLLSADILTSRLQVKDEKIPLWQICLIVMLVIGTILATMRYDIGRPYEPDCRLDEIGFAQDC